jgi:hypothetical protein
VGFSKKILCLGNNLVDTDNKTSDLARQSQAQNFGLVSDPNFIPVEAGYYHTSIYDLQFSELSVLVQQFDQVVFLDQTVDQWPDPNAFYRTVQLINEIEKTTLVVWQNLDMVTGVNFFENLVKTNKSFCILPFIELLIQNGVTMVCCRSQTAITTLNDIADWQTNSEYKKIREKMLAGDMLPEHCGTCYAYEARGIRSARQHETVEWSNRLHLKSIEDVLAIEQPIYYEVRPSNICNLQCRSCNPGNSNLIEKEYIAIGLHDGSKKFKYTGFDFIKLDTLEKLYIAGGEPTAMPELYKFLQECIDNNKVDFEIMINTNAVKLSDKAKNLFKHFSNLYFIVSIDGYKDVNHYVRWPSEWDSIIANTRYLQDNGYGVTFNIVVSIWTISRLHQLIDFLDSEFPTAIVATALAVSENDVFSPFNFVSDTLYDDLVKITKLNCYKNDINLKSCIDGLINHFKNPQLANKQKLIEFFEFNDLLDQSRNVQLKDYIPELDQLRGLVL